MDNSHTSGWLSFLSQIFSWISQGSKIGEDEFSRATSEKGTDMPTFKSSFLGRIGATFGLSGKLGFDDHIREGEIISHEAAKQLGYSDGIVPEKDFNRFVELEDALEDKVSLLTLKLRGRMIEVLESGKSVSYETLFETDAETKRIVSEAAQQGVPPTLVRNVQETLSNGQERVRQSATGFISAMMERDGFDR